MPRIHRKTQYFLIQIWYFEFIGKFWLAGQTKSKIQKIDEITEKPSIYRIKDIEGHEIMWKKVNLIKSIDRKTKDSDNKIKTDLE